MPPSVPFVDALKTQLLVFDGAMGSLLYERGISSPRISSS